MAKKPIHKSEMLKALDHARIDNVLVKLKAWKLSNGEEIELDGWWVMSSHWRGGTHMFKNPANGQIREIRDVTIHEFMGREVYM